MTTAISAIEQATNGPDPLGIPHSTADGVRVWNREPLTIGHVDKNEFVARVNSLLPPRKFVDMAHHENVHPHREWGGWVYCSADQPDAVPITVCVVQDREIPNPADEIMHAAKLMRTHGQRLMDKPEPGFLTESVAFALAMWLRDAADNYDTIVDAPDCPNCGEGCGGHAEQRFCETCGEPSPCDCIERALAAARAIVATTMRGGTR
jgi:hypothetical protein